MTDQPTNPTADKRLRPVPRFEVVHNPRLFVDDDVLAEEPDPQPWHVRIIGANGEPLFSSETYVDERQTTAVILALGVMFDGGDVGNGVEVRLNEVASETESGFPSLELWDTEANGLISEIPILRVEVGP